MGQYHDLLLDVGQDSCSQIGDKLKELSLKKDRIEKLMKDFESPSTPTSNGSRINGLVTPTATTTPIPQSRRVATEQFYGRIWESRTPQNHQTAVLRPIRNVPLPSTPTSTSSTAENRNDEKALQVNTIQRFCAIMFHHVIFSSIFLSHVTAKVRVSGCEERKIVSRTARARFNESSQEYDD